MLLGDLVWKIPPELAEFYNLVFDSET